MRNIWKKILAVCAIALLIVMITAFSLDANSGSDVFSGTLNLVTKPFKSVISGVADKVAAITDQVADYESLKKENAELHAEVAKLQEQYMAFVESNKENERLRELLNLADANPTFKFAKANIIAWNASTWSASFTVNAGSNSGIELNDCVVNEFGQVVGIVTEVVENSAVITTIVDTTSTLSAKVLETDDTVIARGRFEQFADGDLVISYLPDGNNIVSGHMVVTSGIGGLCPAGLLIGTVTGVTKSTSGLDDYATVTPAVNFDTLSSVFVIISY